MSCLCDIKKKKQLYLSRLRWQCLCCADCAVYLSSLRAADCAVQIDVLLVVRVARRRALVDVMIVRIAQRCAVVGLEHAGVELVELVVAGGMVADVARTSSGRRSRSRCATWCRS